MTVGRADSAAGDSVRAGWPFVGRHAEVDDIVAALDDPDTVGAVIHGEPGVGKTRLAEEVLAIAQASGWWCVRAVASERTRQVPLGAIAHLLPARILLDRSDPLTLFPKVAATVKDRGKGRRVVVLVDDLQLLDSTTATLVGQLLDARLNFLIGTVRTGEPVPNNVAGLWRHDKMRRLDIGVLSRVQLQQLLDAALGGPVATAAVDAVWDASQGNALYARELVIGAVDGGHLRDDRGVWRLSGRLEATARLTDAIAARLDVADAEARAALERTALWEPVGLSVLEAAVGPSAIELLERAGLLHIERAGRRQQVRLAHPLYGEILRQGVVTMTRRRLLLERIESIESVGARRREDVVTIASAYLDATGSADSELLLSAAWFARFNHDNVQVERLARAAASDGIGAESGLLLGEALHDLARYDEADEVLTEAIDLVESGDRVFAPLVEMAVRNLVWGLQRPDAALALLKNMRDRTSDSVIRNELVAEEGMVLSYSGRPAEALAVLGALTDDVHPRAWVIAAIAAEPALIATGQFARAIAVGDGAYEDHVQLSEHIAMASPRVHMSFQVEALGYLGRLDESTALATRCYESIPVDAPANAALWFVVRLGRNAMLRGQLQTARRWLAEGVARCERRDAGPRRVVLSLLATAAAWMGDVDAANTAVEELDALTPFAYLPGEQLLGPAWAVAATGALPRARELLVAAAEQVRATGHHPMEAWLLHDACRLGQRGTSARLGELAELCEGSLVAAWARHALGADAGRASDLVAATGQFEDIGAYLLAAETATEATHALQRDGDQRGAAAMRARASLLVDACESARTPALVTSESPVPLTAREREICTLAAAGVSSPEIASKLFLSVRTVNNHLQRAYVKLGVTNRRELAAVLDRIPSDAQRPGD
jgi:ATP/maltotriose-dependent transcriptional regulator MalT